MITQNHPMIILLLPLKNLEADDKQELHSWFLKSM